MSEANMSQIEISTSHGEGHPLTQVSVLEDVRQTMGPKQEMVPLVDYLRDVAGKPRGSATGGREDLNSHNEEFIIKDAWGIHVASLSLSFLIC